MTIRMPRVGKNSNKSKKANEIKRELSVKKKKKK